jgi:RimJ/RimL family protein N-acetyltransferase
MAGAERIYASGNELLDTYPLYTTIVQMRKICMEQMESVANVFPVSEKTAGQWREIYNQRMRCVPNSRTLEQRDEKQLVTESGAYFVHEAGKLLGIGWLSGCELLALAGVEPGEGTCVLQTLLSLADGEQVTLDVASTNIRALRLYEKNGFIKMEEVRRWYCVPQKQED